MANIDVINEKTIRISVDIEDAKKMVNEAASNLSMYAHDIVVIHDKMPAFDFVNFCFYAYNSASLFEWMLGTDPREYTSFSLSAPDGFFYTLYGGAVALYDNARAVLAEDKVQEA